jgi:photosystem II stability/assembly factor-like uncharacterized protein
MRPTFFSILFFIQIFTTSCAFSADNEWSLIGPGDADQVTAITALPDGSVWVGTDVGGIYQSTDKGVSWSPRNNGLTNLDVTTPLAFHISRPEQLFLGTRGGLFASQDSGESWSSVRSGLPAVNRYKLSGSIGGLAVDPFDAKKLLLGMGYRPSYQGNTTIKRLEWRDNLYASSDGGKTWDSVKAFSKANRVNQLVYSSTTRHLVYAATEAGLYRSEDGGARWNSILSSNVLNVVENADDPSVIVVAIGGSGVMRSEDGGKSWLQSNEGLRMTIYGVIHRNRYCCFAYDANDSNTLYVANSSWGYGGGLYRSEDFGGSWDHASTELPESWLDTSKRFNAAAILPTSKGKSVFAGTSRYLYRSDDEGNNWQQLISTGSRETGWSNTGINVFGQTRQLYVDIDDPAMMFIGTADHKLVKSTDSGGSWHLLERNNKDASNIWDMAMCPAEPKTFYAVTSGNRKQVCLMSSANKGESWRTSCGGLGSSDRYERLLIDPQDCNRVYVGTRAGLKVSTSSGASWATMSGFPETKVYDLVFGEDNKTIYAATPKGLIATKNKGLSWQVLKTFGGNHATSVMVSKLNANWLLVGTKRKGSKMGSIYLSQNSGKSWDQVLDNINQYVTGFAQLPSNPSVIYSSTMDHNYHDVSKGSGVFRSVDHGKTWEAVLDGLPVFRGYRISSSTLLPNKIFFASAGSGVYVLEHK